MGRVHDVSRLRRRAALALLAAAVLCVWGAQALHRRVMADRLLSVFPDRVPGDAALAKFARDQAAPLYREYCSSCHGDNLKGDRARGIPDLTDRDWLYGSGEVSDIERVVLYGIRSGVGKGWNLANMPAYAQHVPYRRFAIESLTPGDIEDTVEYLRAIEGRSADKEAAARGEKIFQGRGACFDCHGADARGDTAIGAPNLADDLWLYGDGSRQSVFESIARGHQGSCPAWFRRIPAWKARALAVYVYDASHPPRGPG
jgi:cytochrome c oxidase cbb3-type subunit 3